MMMLLVGMSANATITSGGWYRIKSYAYNTRYITENYTEKTLVTTSLNESNFAQVWSITVNGSNVTIKNVLTERYIQKATGNSWSVQYTTGTATPTFSTTENSDGTIYFGDKWDGGLHCAASQSYDVVLWANNTDGSKWVLEEVDFDVSTIQSLQAQKLAIAEPDNNKLTQFFTSTACIALKSTYSSFSDEDLRTAMSDLPTSTQDLAIKIKNNSWATYSGWNKTERTFRIADYKAYSSGWRWTNILGYRHQFGRLSNPTGIYAEEGEYLQVYVGSIPSGQTVKLEVAGLGQAAGTTYSLHEGMNSLLMSSSGNCFVFYEVDNTTNGAAPFTALSNTNYPDVTVHIEGGTVQGYFDLTKGDNDDDWARLYTNLLSKETVCLKSTKHVMNLKKDWLITALNGSSIVDMINVWSNLSQWEDELTGRSDTQGQQTYGQYCNNLYSVTSCPGTGSPHASNYGTYYYDYSHNAIFNANNLMTVADNMWCIAHEQGHNRQNPINMVGNTEISNNLFSNVAIYKQGRFTSRTASIQETFKDFMEGVSWPERVRRSCSGVDGYNQQMTHLNWQLYLYFHVNYNDTDFFPRLFDALRADPMTRTEGSDKLTPADTDYLKYYVKCCQVSGYDLTDFFAAYGFFILPPEQENSITYNGTTTKRYVTIPDYNTSNLYVTQEMINTAKTQVANMNLTKCNMVFIEDRVTAPEATYDGHAADEKRLINPDAPVKSFGAVGEMGQYTTFNEPCSDYRFNVDEQGNVTAEGRGAVGFKVYNSNGDLVGFFNTHSFTLPKNIGTGYTIKAAAGNGTDVVATIDNEIEVHAFPKPDTWYTLCTPLRGNRYTKSNGAGLGVVGASNTTISNDMMWKFIERAGEKGVYDIQNRNDNSYLSQTTVSGSSQITTTSSRPSAGWKLAPAATKGLYIIYSGSVQLNQTNIGGTNGNMVYNYGGGTNTGDDGCQFAISEFSSTALPELVGFNIGISSTAANDLAVGQWYTMFDRGNNNNNRHGYLYENTETRTLYNTDTQPTGTATGACKYLVRLVDAGDGNYYLQTGYGNYFSYFPNTGNVAVTPTPIYKVKVEKIANTDGHFYLQSISNNIILDANTTVTGDATVVGYKDEVPTGINGNNDWAFYPVTLSREVTLHTVGNKSYATFYLDKSVTTDDNTKAYYITSVNDNHARLTAVGGEGHNVPPFTAVVLISDNTGNPASATLYGGNEYERTVTKGENLLKGTLTGLSLDLSSESHYYTLGQSSGNVGFYKYLSGNSTTLNLAANKAYLEYSSVAGAKGFSIIWDEATGINPIGQSDYLQLDDDNWYTLSGLRISKPVKRGIYIHNGKKVVIK